MDRFAVLSFSTDPLHTHTYIHFALREHRFRYYFCLTATQTGLEKPGDCSPLARVHTHADAHTHSCGLTCASPSPQDWRHVEVTWGCQHICVALSFSCATYNEEASSWVTVWMYTESVKAPVELKVSRLFRKRSLFAWLLLACARQNYLKSCAPLRAELCVFHQL